MFEKLGTTIKFSNLHKDCKGMIADAMISALCGRVRGWFDVVIFQVGTETGGLWETNC